MTKYKSHKIFIVALMVLGLGASTFALWPGPRDVPGQADSEEDLLRKIRPEALQPWSNKWPDVHFARILSQLPLYGSLLDFYIIEAVEEGLVGVALLTLPEHTNSSRVWLACLQDADTLIFRALELHGDMRGIYVVAGFELGDCQDGCSDHFYDLWGIYVTREQALRDGPRGWRILSEDIWWDLDFFYQEGGS